MPELDYHRHEQFAQCVALGVTTTPQCYEAAGYHRDREVALNLAKTAKIAERIREIEMENATAS